MLKEQPDLVDEETRRLLLNFRLPQDPEEAEWEVFIRKRTENLLLQYGSLPYSALEISKDKVEQMLHPVEPEGWLGRITFIASSFKTAREKDRTRAQQLVDFLTTTPLREIDIPFKGHAIKIASFSKPSLHREIKHSAHRILYGEKGLSAPRLSIGDCLLHFTSTAWWPGKSGAGFGYLIYPDSMEDEFRQSNILFGSLSMTARAQTEAIVMYTEKYFNSKPTPGVG